MEKKKSRVGKLGINCEGFGEKFGQLKKCSQCRDSKHIGSKKCREQSPKSDEKPRNRRQRKKRKVIARSYETCRGPFEMDCEQCPEFQFQECDGHYFSKKPRWVIDKYSKQLTGAEQKVLDCLESRASFKSGDDFGYCYPSHENVAETTGLSIKYVGSCIKSLESKGLVKQEWKRFPKAGGGFVTHHAYCVTYLIRQKELDEKKHNTV